MSKRLKNKTIMTVTGIRPDFIRMSAVFKELDLATNHILVHTGQHYNHFLSDVFFKDLKIRHPDYNLKIGKDGRTHVEQQAEVSIKLVNLLKSIDHRPDIILFLGDSNSVTAAVPLKKEGYTIGHIEGGMRSGDKRMLEEINRIVCDHCSDFHFVYHKNYKKNLVQENISENGIYIVGNTIVEVANPIIKKLKRRPSRRNQIILDIHRPENFKNPDRLKNIMDFVDQASKIYEIPVKMIKFKRTLKNIEKFRIGIHDQIQMVDLMSYKEFLSEQYNSHCIISDSGTAQEEPALLGVPVIVPRDFTERPESVRYGNSIMIDVNNSDQICWIKIKRFINDSIKYGNMRTDWLGDGTTSKMIINTLSNIL